MKLTTQAVRILGIDPGSRITGFGVIEVCGQQNTHLHSGCIKTGSEADLAGRLKAIYEGLSAIVADYQPAEVAIEKIFMNKNADSALKLGQARGAAIVATMQAEVEIFEYTPNRIKQAIVGRGHADKLQVQHMIKILLNLPQKPQPDQADALAVALCHGHSRQMVALTGKLAGLA